MPTPVAAPPVGTVRGPWKSSPGNPYPWQAAYRTANGWAYCFSRRDGADALAQAQHAANALRGA